MTKLVDKLNTLVRAGVRGALGNDPDRRIRRGKRPSSGEATERNITTLRVQINQALDHEDRMIEELNAMQRQIADWDQQADAALQKGDEATARNAIRQMQLQRQRSTMLQADLEQHKFATAELISRVNELEAIVAEAQQQAEQIDSPASDAGQHDLSHARAQDIPQSTAQSTYEAATDERPSSPALAQQDDEQAIEDDLARRRKRLSL